MRKKKSGFLAAIILILLVLGLRAGIEMVNHRRSEAMAVNAATRASDSTSTVRLDSVARSETAADSSVRGKSKVSKKTSRKSSRRPVARDFLGDSIASNRQAGRRPHTGGDTPRR